MAKYKWRQNLACVATYKILDIFLDEFDDVSFDDAADLTMKDLRYFPGSTSNANIIKVLATETARHFLRHLVKNYIVVAEDSSTPSSQFITKLRDVFRDKDKTVRELAEVVDALIKFKDE